jgi:hypothetical protein
MKPKGSPKEMFLYFYITIIFIVLSSPLHSIGQIYKWVDEEGIVHFTDDPSKIPEKYVSKSEKPRQAIPVSPSVVVEASKDDLKLPGDRKSNGVTFTQWVFRVYEGRPVRNLIYLIGLFIILLLLIKILKEPRPTEVLKRPAGSIKRPIIFDVYYGNYPTDSMVFLGKIIERRRKERGNNRKDLLYKARQDYSPRVKDPSAILLLSS